MQHGDRQRLRVLRNLIEGVEMIAVETLSRGSGIVVIVSAGRVHHRPANGNFTLRLNGQRLDLSA